MIVRSFKSVLAPYFAWKSTHHAHHKATVSIERDENYVPRTRSDFGLPPESTARLVDYHELFEETPIYTVARMLLMQLLGWQIYLTLDTMGSPRHPKGTNVCNTQAILDPMSEHSPNISTSALRLHCSNLMNATESLPQISD